MSEHFTLKGLKLSPNGKETNYNIHVGLRARDGGILFDKAK